MHANRKNHPCKLVSFSGMDGAGKGTQIDALRNCLEQAGLRVQVITFWNDVARLTGIREATGHKVFRGDKGVGTPESPINRRDKNVRSIWMSGLRLWLYLLDAVSLRFVVARTLRSGVDFVICDRYIYDELANLPLHNAGARLYIQWIAKLAPKPDVSYLLDADPIQARARKPEYPLDFLYTNRAAYLALSDLVGMTIIAPMPIEDVKQGVLQHALRLVPQDGTTKKPDETVGKKMR